VTFSLTALPLRVRALVTNPILLNEHKGSALRGALFDALRKRSCARLELQSCHPCELVPVCPISALVATVDPEWERGTDPPRPLVIDPPLDELVTYPADAKLEFGVTVFGSAGRLLPYVVLALGDIGKAGLGRKYERDGFWTRGRFEVERVELADPFSGDRELLYSGDAGGQPVFHSPRGKVESGGMALPEVSRIELEFVTPTRLVRQGELAPRFELLPFLQRLRERLEALDRRYGAHELPPGERRGYPFDAVQVAGEIDLTDDRTAWQDVRAYSRRQKQAVPVGGFLGTVTLEGNLAPLLPYLAWGQLTHVGKDATKGNGWYRLRC